MLQKDHKCGKASSNICCLKQLKNFNHLNKASGRHRSAASRYLEVANIHTKIGLQKKKTFVVILDKLATWLYLGY